MQSISDCIYSKWKGCELTSADGDTYVDFLGEYTAGLFGHSNQVIAEAIGDAMTQGWSFGGPNSFEKKLARKVCLSVSYVSASHAFIYPSITRTML